jgi:hypothetical protein
MNIKELAHNFSDRLAGEIGPVLIKQCSKSAKFPNYKGLFRDSTFPISEICGSQWYRLSIEMKWNPTLSSAGYACCVLFEFFFPIKNTKKIFFKMGRTRLNRGNIDTFLESKAKKSLELLAIEQGWDLEKPRDLPEIKVLTTSESDKIIHVTKIKSSLLK